MFLIGSAKVGRPQFRRPQLCRPQAECESNGTSHLLLSVRPDLVLTSVSPSQSLCSAYLIRSSLALTSTMNSSVVLCSVSSQRLSGRENLVTVCIQLVHPSTFLRVFRLLLEPWHLCVWKMAAVRIFLWLPAAFSTAFHFQSLHFLLRFWCHLAEKLGPVFS